MVVGVKRKIVPRVGMPIVWTIIMNVHPPSTGEEELLFVYTSYKPSLDSAKDLFVFFFSLEVSPSQKKVDGKLKSRR